MSCLRSPFFVIAATQAFYSIFIVGYQYSLNSHFYLYKSFVSIVFKKTLKKLQSIYLDFSKGSTAASYN